jgi:tetratricopeptide (TPR) repeat protein
MLSLEHYNNLIAQNRRNPAALIDMTNTIIGQKEATPQHYNVALKALDLAVALSSKNIQALYNRGRVRTMLGLHTGALRDFTQCIQLDAQDAGVWYRRGLVFYELKDYKNAVMDFVHSIQLAPEILETYLLRGYAVMNLGGYEEAIQDFEHVIRHKAPFSAEALYHRSKCFYNIQRMDLAIKDCDNLLQIGWIATDVYALRAMAYLHFQNYQKALEDYDEALKLDPTNEDLLHNRAEVWKAIQDLRKQAGTTPEEVTTATTEEKPVEKPKRTRKKKEVE